MAKKGGKMLQWINYRVRVTITDGRQMCGNLLAFDKHMNTVLSDTEEFRKVKPKKPGEIEREQKRMLGMILLRGENIVSITAEAPPPPQTRRPGEGIVVGRAQAIGRGAPMMPGPNQAPPGLAAPAVLKGPAAGPPANLPPQMRPPPPGFQPS